MGWLKDLQNLKWKDLDPFNKNSLVREKLRELDESFFQPIWEQVVDVALLAPIARYYLNYIKDQAEGKYKKLPLWLKLILQEMAIYNVDLTRVYYAENIDTLQEGNAVTIGYNIHFPTVIGIGETFAESKDDIKWLLHEMKHVEQYKDEGGVTPFLHKYLIQTYTGALEQLTHSWKNYINNVHDDLKLESKAEETANANIKAYMEMGKTLPLGRPTVPGRNLGSRMLLNNSTMYEGDYLKSDNGLYRLILQADGNVVLYEGGSTVIWASSTDGMGWPPYRIVFQADGNVVQYDGHNTSERALWRTSTNGLAGQVFVLQDDRNMVIYASGNKAVWESHTYPGAS